MLGELDGTYFSPWKVAVFVNTMFFAITERFRGSSLSKKSVLVELFQENC